MTRPSASGSPEPVGAQWVVLHRVGSDRAAPMDSVRTARDGRFRFRYTPFGAEDALYFVSARHAGITYFSPPLRGDTVRGEDADIIVYDASTDTTSLSVQGRHLVVSAARASDAKREVAEVFEIENEGTHTVIPSDSLTPIWSAPLPAAAESASVAPGDIGAGAVEFRNGRAALFAPISPGVRQLVVTYLLPADEFPLSRPVERATSVLEVLLQEPTASVSGARLSEVPAATIDGRTFRRFLAQDVPAASVIRVEVPRPVASNGSAMRVLAAVMALMMLGAIGVWFARRRTAGASSGRPRSDVLIAELAALDARFERNPAPDAGARASHRQERDALKARIAVALAAEEHRA